MGNAVVLEAVVIASIMVSAVAYVATYDDPGTSLDAIDAKLTQKAREFLLTAEDMPLAASLCKGDTQLEGLVIDGVQGDHGNFTRKYDKMLGVGVAANMLLDNGEAFYPLHMTAPDFNGSTGVRTLWADWARAQPFIQTSQVRGIEGALFDVVGSRIGTLVKQKGEAVRTSVSYSTVGTPHVEVGWVPTALVPLGNTNLSGLNWTMGQAEIEAGDLREGFMQRFDLRVSSVISGSQSPNVTVSLPNGWAVEAIDAPEGKWESTTDSTTRTILLNATAPLTTNETIAIYLIPPSSPLRPFDVISARMTNGALHQAHMVVTYPTVEDTSFPREVYASMPYPLPFGEDAVIGVVFANGGEEVNVTQIDIEVPGGYDLTHRHGQPAALFADAPLVAVDGEGVWTRVAGTHLRWSDPDGKVIGAGQAASWQVRVRVTDDPAQETAMESLTIGGPTATLRFPNGYAVNSSVWGSSPGILRVRVPPDDTATGDADGYPIIVGAPVPVNGSVATVFGKLYGDASYSVSPAGSDLVRLENSLANSSIAVAQRMVPLGGVATIDASLESLITSVVQAGGTDTTLTFELYPPPTLGCRPAATWTKSLVELPTQAAHLTMVWDGGTGIDGSFAALGTGRVVRHAAPGVLLWSTKLDGKVVAWARLEAGPLASGVAVGLDDGRVCVLESLSGAIRWCDALSAEAPVVAIGADGASGFLVACAADGSLASWRAEGAAYARSLADGACLDVVHGPAGWAILTPTGLERRTNELGIEATASIDDALGLAWNDEAILVAREGAVLWLRETDLSTTLELPIPEIGLVARGDGNGDGLEDLALTYGTDLVRLFDATGPLWTATADVGPTPMSYELEGGLVVGGRDLSGFVGTCRTPDLPRYGETEVCLTQPAPAADQQLSAEGGRVYLRQTVSGSPRILAFDGGAIPQAILLDPTREILHHASGTVAAARRVLVADGNGELTPYDPATGLAGTRYRAHEEPAELSASFRVPKGGFYGTHVVTATLSWATATQTPQSATLVDWFEVVGSDGRPVTNPSYQTVLVVEDRGIVR